MRFRVAQQPAVRLHEQSRLLPGEDTVPLESVKLPDDQIVWHTKIREIEHLRVLGAMQSAETPETAVDEKRNVLGACAVGVRNLDALRSHAT